MTWEKQQTATVSLSIIGHKRQKWIWNSGMKESAAVSLVFLCRKKAQKRVSDGGGSFVRL